MSRRVVVRKSWPLLLGVGCLVLGGGILPTFGAPDTPAATTQPTRFSIKGTCNFGGRASTWSAIMTAKGNETYDAAYVATWGGKPLQYVGTIETDGKTKIKGRGKASGGSANGTFEFSGTYGNDGIARCSYKEIGGGRKGALTAELPKPAAENAPTTAPAPAK